MFRLHTTILFIEKQHKSKKVRAHTLTASMSSTIAEEIVVLIRRLHPLKAWSPLINKYISRSLQDVPHLIAAPHLRLSGGKSKNKETVRPFSDNM